MSSHSLISKRSRTRSVKLSGSWDSLNMALASDSLFDKFGLWSSINEDPIHESELIQDLPAAPANEITESLPNIEDLDFSDILDIKEEQQPFLNTADSLLTSNQHVQEDPFSFNMESLVDDASLDSIKSDCMWSSAVGNLFSNIDNAASNNSRKRRHRDVSLTLSEFNEGLLSINQLDVNMLEHIADAPLGESPTFMSSTFGSFGNEDESDESSSNDEEDDEIDVVGDLGGSSARTRHIHNLNSRHSSALANSSSKPKTVKIEAGRSLLKKQQPQVTTPHKSTSILDDHCYFLDSSRVQSQQPQTNHTTTTSVLKSQPLKGMLTPNESSEDEDCDLFKTGTTTMTSVVDKRKIAEAVQSLIKNRPEQACNKLGNIKFKFRMKFKSTQAASNMKKAAKLSEKIISSSSTFSTSTPRERRKSASNNAYCPPPTASNSSKSPKAQQQQASPMKKSRGQSLLQQKAAKASAAAASANSSLDSDKCREIRDLHNSMERQRRVEQRNHLAHLKKQVPEVADLEKASKLTILRKARDYCHLLSNLDQRIRKEKDRETARNQMLKKRLLELTQKHDARRMTTSGRLTGWASGRY